jgi:hypothetical protein
MYRYRKPKRYANVVAPFIFFAASFIFVAPSFICFASPFVFVAPPFPPAEIYFTGFARLELIKPATGKIFHYLCGDKIIKREIQNEKRNDGSRISRNVV